MVSVSYIEQWGRQRGRWHSGIKGLKKGDLVVLFAHGRHVEMAAADATSRGYYSVGGNTSAANQWNGGTVAYQWRRAANVVGYVRIHDKYPTTPPFKPSKFPLKVGQYFGKKLKFKASIRKNIHNGNATFADQSNVLRIQKWLKYLGYYKGPLTGTANDGLHKAIVSYQKKHNYRNPNGAVGGGPTGRGGTWKALQQSVYNKRYK